ncbi:MAG: yacG [Hyphomicrobiales bacterium]|nr:yacG [Hyphomicrobiales bacterium]
MNIANDNAAKAAPCPICRKASALAYRPFCSKRCADVDLARWLGGTYAIPAAPTDPDEDDEETPPRRPRASDED